MFKRLFSVVLLASLILSGWPSQAGFEFPDFSKSEKINILHDALISDESLRLTPAEYHLEGAVWYQEKQRVDGGFTTSLSFRMLEVGGLPEFTSTVEAGADGFAFVIQNHRSDALGATGEGIGYKNLPNSVAVEFDTFDNGPIRWEGNGDPNNNHISVNTLGTQPNNSFHYASLGVTTDIPQLSDGQVHDVVVDYTPGTLSIYIDDTNEPALSVPLDLSAKLNLDNGKAWVGFVSSTGAVWETHDILSWSFEEHADYYVDPVAGSDLNDGSSPLTAFRTITKAVGFVPEDSIIRLLPGVCSSQTGEAFPIVIRKPLSIVGQDRDSCVLLHQPTDNIRTLVCSHTPGQCVLANFTIVGGFTGLTHDPFPFHGSTTLAKNLLIMMTTEHGILVNRDGATLEDCVVLQTPSSGILYLAFEEGSCTIDRCISAGNLIHGFDQYNPSDLILRNSLAIGNQQHGVFITDNGRATLTNNTLSRNALNGVAANSPFLSRIANCILHDNNGGVHENLAGSDPEVLNNLFYGNNHQYIDEGSNNRDSEIAINSMVDNGGATVANNLLADPLFIGTSSGVVTGGSMTSVSYDPGSFSSTVTDGSATWAPDMWKGAFLLVGPSPRPKSAYLISHNSETSIIVYADITDPLYGNASMGTSYQILDYHVQALSPAIDQGDGSLPDLGDLDGDGRCRVAGLGIDIGAFESGAEFPPATPTPTPQATGTATPTPSPTATLVHTPTRTPTGTYNRPPSAPLVQIHPESPKTDDDLMAVATGSVDPEGQVPSYSYEWYRNAVFVSNETEFFSHTMTAKGDAIQCLVRATDGETFSEPGEQTVVIANSPPTAPVVKILPDNPSPRSGLAVRIETPSSDADGDTLLYLFEWFESDDGSNWVRRPELSGNLKPFVTGEPEISSLYTQIAEYWRVQVTPVEADTVAKKGGSPKVAGSPVTGEPGVDQVLILPDLAVSSSGNPEDRIDSDDLLALLEVWGITKSNLSGPLQDQFFDSFDSNDSKVGLRHLLALARYGWYRMAQTNQSEP